MASCDRWRLRRVVLAVWTSVLCLPPVAAGTFELVTRTGLPAVIQPDGDIVGTPDSSQDGRYVVFTSEAGNLVPGDTNQCSDIFLADRLSAAPTLELISRNASGEIAFGCSLKPQISADGRFVAFHSSAHNLDDTATPGAGIYLRDRLAGTTRRIDIDTGGTVYHGTAVALSRNGAYAAILSANGSVYRKDLLAGTLVPASQDGLGNLIAGVTDIAIADDGSVIAFHTAADVAVLGDTDSALDAYLRDMGTGALELTSRDHTGANSAEAILGFDGATRWLSGSGGRLLFNTDEALVTLDLPRSGGNTDAYLYTRGSPGGGPGTIARISVAGDGAASDRAIVARGLSADGGRVLLAGILVDAGITYAPLFAKEVGTGVLHSVTRDPSSGSPSSCCLGYVTASPLLQPDGLAALLTVYDPRRVNTVATNPRTDVLRYPLDSGANELVSKPDRRPENTLPAADATTHATPGINHWPLGGTVSADGGLVLFASEASNLVVGDGNRARDLFLRDMAGAATTRLLTGFAPTDHCAAVEADMSPDGRYIAFESCDAHLPDATFEQRGFLLDRQTGTVSVVSRLPGASGTQFGVAIFSGIRVSDDGRRVLLASYVDLADEGRGGGVFLRDLNDHSVSRVSVAEDGSAFQSVAYAGALGLSGNGRVALLGSTQAVVNAQPGGENHVYARDLETGEWDWISAPLAGTPSSNSYPLGISADGRYVLFYAEFGYPGAIYVYDRQTGQRQRADVGNDGRPLSAHVGAFRGALSDDGRYVVFSTYADAFATGETATGQQVYVRDLRNGVTARLSVRNDGALANGMHDVSGISADGRWIVLASTATNLIDDDLNGRVQDLFRVANPLFGEELVSDVDTLTPGAVEASREAAVSADGRYVVFESLDPRLQAACPGAPGQPVLCADPDDCPADGTLYVFRLDTTQGCTDLISADAAGALIAMRARLLHKGLPVGDAELGKPSLSADGQWVAFVADDVVTGKLTGESTKARAARRKAGGISVLLRNALTGTTRRLGGSAGVGADPGGTGVGVDGGRPQVAPNGQSIVYTGLIGSKPAVLQTLLVGTVPVQTVCVSCNRPAGIATGGAETFTEPLDGFAHNAVVSADGRLVAYETVAKDAAPANCNNGVASSSVVLRNMLTGTTRQLNQPRGTACQLGSAGKPSIDFSGTRVVFESSQPLLPGAGARPEIYLYDSTSDSISQVSVDAQGGQVDAASRAPAISGDGGVVAFTSPALHGFGAELPAGPAVNHVVMGGLRGGRVAQRLSKNLNGINADGDSERPALSYTGEYVVFDSVAGNLSLADTNGGTRDVFLRFNPVVRERVFGSGFD